MKIAKEKGLSGSFQELCDNDTVKKEVQDEMDHAAKASKLNSLEQVKANIPQVDALGTVTAAQLRHGLIKEER